MADGDSWFDYPLNGTIPGVSRTDIISQLPSLCAKKPYILKLAHYGDTSTTELGLERTQKIVAALNDANNGKFDAILFSGGGNDVVGDPLVIWLNDAKEAGGNPAYGLNQTRFNGILGVIKSSLLDLIALRDEYLPKAPIFVHAYDLAIPSGIGAPCGIGPWLKPALDFCGWTDANEARQIVASALSQLGTLVGSIASNPDNNVIYVETQGILNDADWDNELHPKPPGFKNIALKWREALAAKFPGRV